MWSRIAYRCARGCRPTYLLGWASALGTLLVAAILVQPLAGAQFGEDAGAVSADGNDSTVFSASPLTEDRGSTPFSPSLAAAVTEERPVEHGEASCLPCDPTARCGARRYLFADALYWTVREGAAENWAQIITPKSGLWTNVGTATLVDAPFDWRAGLRVGGGVQQNDGSDMTLYYTNYRTTATSQAAGEVYSAFMGNFYVGNTDGSDYGPHYHQASIWWDFDFHTIDFEIGHNYAIGTNLELRPFLGLKATIIKQTIRSNWRNPIDTTGPAMPHIYTFTSATEDLNLGFWGIGPSLGTTITMPLCSKERYDLKLFGTPSGAIMFGHWTFDEQYVNSSATRIAFDTNPITSAATMLRGVVGFEWEQRFSRASSTVRLGYEAQLWLNQMQFYSYNMGRLNNVTSLQGGFLEWQLNF
jgi:hypothetical protein